MAKQIIGVLAGYGDAKKNVERIVEIEQAGVPAAWLTTGGAAPDALTTFAGAAVRTSRIALGTSITPVWPRHPVAVVQQAAAISSLAPGRFRLGLGSANKSVVESSYGYSYRSPHEYMEEYVRIVKALLGEGKVDFDGKHLHAHVRLPAPLPAEVPVMVASLSTKSFERYARISDGLISWVCPTAYLRDKALPAIQAGAKQANREAPPLVAHVPVCLHDNIAEARNAAREQLAIYPRLPTYQTMFAEAGFPEVAKGAWSDAMLDAVVAMGSSEQVVERLREVFSFGAREIIVHPVAVGADADAAFRKTLETVGRVSAMLP